MSSWDREATMDQYKDMFAETSDPEALMEQIGTPTHVAIQIANSYVPTPRPQAVSSLPEGEELRSDEMYYYDDDVDASAIFPGEDSPEGLDMAVEKKPRRALRPGVTALYILISTLIGVPILLVLLLIGVPVMGTGAGLIAASLYAFLTLVAKLGMFSDVLMMIGLGLVLSGIGLLILWLGIWLDLKIAMLWIGGVLVRLGEKFCLKHEPQEEPDFPDSY